MTPTSKPPTNCSSSSSPQRRLRTNARVVKRKMSNYQLKRPEHRNPPKPTKRPEDATVIRAA